LIHSVALNLAVAVGLRYFWLRTDAAPDWKRVLLSLGLACLTHPILDATTPKGLPFLY
jgi:membrane-bound metal-dependent hydrolase YbcI (DUF457 family)